MKPKTLGDMPQPLAAPPSPSSLDGSEAAPPPQPEALNIEESELRLLHQEFLMKPDMRVADFLREQHAVVNDFVRFECGEVLENE
jgi:hypothetical protein